MEVEFLCAVLCRFGVQGVVLWTARSGRKQRVVEDSGVEQMQVLLMTCSSWTMLDVGTVAMTWHA
jgi:hypothetical protein